MLWLIGDLIEHSVGDEADRVNENRNKDYFLPKLALLAKKDGQIVGYIALHDITIAYSNGDADVQVEVAPPREKNFLEGQPLSILYAILEARIINYPRRLGNQWVESPVRRQCQTIYML